MFTHSPACTLVELVWNIQTHRDCRLDRLDHDAGSVPEREMLDRSLCREQNVTGMSMRDSSTHSQGCISTPSCVAYGDN